MIYEKNIMNLSSELDLIRLDLPATPKYLNVLSACIGSMLEHEPEPSDMGQVIYNIILATHEVCVNIVEHAYAGLEGRIAISLSLAKEPRQFIVDLHDNGLSFSMPEIRVPNQDEIQTSGYGLYLIHQLMDQVEYDPESGNNHWRLMKNL
jgi:serine/threonine-protein kinase RsbW